MLGGLSTSVNKMAMGAWRGDFDQTILAQIVDALGGGAADSAAVQALSQYIMPWIQAGRHKLIDFATGTNGQVLRSSMFANNKPLSTTLRDIQIAVNSPYHARWTGEKFDTLRGLAGEQAQQLTNQLKQTLFGYSAAAAAADTSGLANSLLKGALAVPIIKPLEGITQNTISALQTRRAALGNFDSPNTPVGVNSLRDTAEQLQRQLFAGAIQTNRFNGISASDIAGLVSHAVSTGRADLAANGIDRANLIANFVASRSRTMHNLRSAFGEDIPTAELITRMSKLYGSNVLNLGAGNQEGLSSRLSQLQNTMGLDFQQLARYTGIGYAAIAPYGGSQSMGMSIGLTTTALTGSTDVRVSGLSNEQYRAEVNKVASNVALRGDTRRISAAYNVWLQKTGQEHSAVNFDKFKSSVNLKYVATEEGLQRYIGRSLGVYDREELRRISYAAQNQSSTEELMATTDANKEATNNVFADRSRSFERRAAGILGRYGTSAGRFAGGVRGLLTMSRAERRAAFRKAGVTGVKDQFLLMGDLQKALKDTGADISIDGKSFEEWYTRANSDGKIADVKRPDVDVPSRGMEALARYSYATKGKQYPTIPQTLGILAGTSAPWMANVRQALGIKETTPAGTGSFTDGLSSLGKDIERALAELLETVKFILGKLNING